MENQEIITVHELAKKLRVPVSWVYRQTSRKDPGCMPRIQVGKYVRFRFSEVLDWLNVQDTEVGQR